MSGSSPIKSPRNLGIDALRGFAAIAVMLYHFVGYFKISGVEPQFGKWIVDIASHGKLGVIVFFVLSGYVIAMTSQQVKFSFASSLRFLARRLTRLIPPYWALIVGLTILYAAAKSAGYLANSQLTIAQVLANLFYLQGLAEAVPMSPVFWTLCIEVQFYLVFASLRSVIAIAFNGRGATPTTAIFALSMAASVAWRASVPRDDIWFMGYWYQFAFGILAYRLASSPRFRAFPTLLILSAR